MGRGTLSGTGAGTPVQPHGGCVKGVENVVGRLWLAVILILAVAVRPVAEVHAQAASPQKAASPARSGSGDGKAAVSPKKGTSGKKGTKTPAKSTPSAPASSAAPSLPKSTAPASVPVAPSPSPPAPALTVLPLLGLGETASLAPNLTGLLFTELRRFEGVEIRIRRPPQPLTGTCIVSLSCLAQLGQQLEAPRLLVGVVSRRATGLSLTLLMVDVATQRPLKSATLELVGSPDAYGRLLGPVVETLAVAAGARIKADTGEAPVVMQSTSLESLIDAAPAGAASTGSTPAELGGGQKAKRGGTSSAAPGTSSGDRVLGGGDAVALEREQKARAKELEAIAAKEAQLREKERLASEREQQRRMREQEREAEVRRKAEIKEVQRLAKLEEQWQASVQAVRQQNLERREKGLPPLPEPPRPTRELMASGSPPAAKSSAPVSQKSGAESKTASSKNGAAAPTPVARAASPADARKTLDAVEAPAARVATDDFLESDGPWQVGLLVGTSALVGYTLVGPMLQVGYEVLPQLWVEGGIESLHGNDPNLLAWFYFFSANAGVSRRFGEGRVHPFAGGNLILSILGPNAQGLGAVARGGLDVMVRDEVGVRIELSAGILFSGALAAPPYNYPAATQALLRVGLGGHWRF